MDFTNISISNSVSWSYIIFQGIMTRNFVNYDPNYPSIVYYKTVLHFFQGLKTWQELRTKLFFYFFLKIGHISEAQIDVHHRSTK